MTPERFGPFVLYERLSAFAGEAYRARRVVAPGQLSAPFVLEVFRSASRSFASERVRAGEWGARVASPGVLRVLEVGRIEERLYVASELAEGEDLATVLGAAEPGERAPSVPAALAIGAQLARVARQVYDAGGGREKLGLFRPRDVFLGYDGRVRVRASGAVERPAPGESRDPFLAPELGRGAPFGPAADVWTVTRVLRAVLAADPLGKQTPKLSAFYKDSLGAILVEGLAREPGARLPVVELEHRLYELAREDDPDLSGPIIELLEEHAGGEIPPREDPLGVEELAPYARVPGPSGELLFSAMREEAVVFGRVRDKGRVADREPPRTEIRRAPAGAFDDIGSSIFGRALEEAEREMAMARGEPEVSRTGTFGRPRVELPSSEEEGSLEASAVSEDVRLGSATQLFEDDDDELDLDAIARSSLAGQAPVEESLATAGTAVVARPAPLPPSQHDDGDVFQAGPPATKVARLGSRSRASIVASRVDDTRAPAADDDVFAHSSDAAEDEVFSTVPPSEPIAAPPASPALDPDKTAYLDNPVDVFESSFGSRTDSRVHGPSQSYGRSRRGEAPLSRASVLPLTALPPADDDDDEELPTERLSADLVSEAVRLARGAPADTPVEVASGPPSVLEEELGRLVIDVPPGAIVFVNGEERGRGPTTLEDVDRFANLVVRVHHRGHHPWTGTVTLKGMPAARVAPELQRR